MARLNAWMWRYIKRKRGGSTPATALLDDTGAALLDSAAANLLEGSA